MRNKAMAREITYQLDSTNQTLSIDIGPPGSRDSANGIQSLLLRAV